MLTCISVVILDVQPLFKLALGQTFVQSLYTLCLEEMLLLGRFNFSHGSVLETFHPKELIVK